MTGSVYLIENMLNGKEYIGQTTQPVRRRWSQHVCDAKKERDYTQLHKAIRKYGRDAFTVSELISFESDNHDFLFDMLSQFEQGMVTLFDCLIPKGYNWQQGGSGGGPGDWAGDRNPMFGRHHKPETIEKLKGPHSPEHCHRISESKKGKPTWASLHPDIVAEQTRARKIGVHRTDQEKRKISEARMGRFTGADNPYFGRKHSEEVRMKMCGPRPSIAGKNHPLFGKHLSAETKAKIAATKLARRVATSM